MKQLIKIQNNKIFRILSFHFILSSLSVCISFLHYLLRPLNSYVPDSRLAVSLHPTRICSWQSGDGDDNSSYSYCNVQLGMFAVVIASTAIPLNIFYFRFDKVFRVSHMSHSWTSGCSSVWSLSSVASLSSSLWPSTSGQGGRGRGTGWGSLWQWKLNANISFISSLSFSARLFCHLFSLCSTFATGLHYWQDI